MGLYEDIQKKLEERKRKVGDLAPWWDVKKVGQNISGSITKIRKNPWEDDKFLYEVTPLEGGETVTLPAHTILMKAFENLNVHEGDYVMIEYKGEVKTSRGINAKDYEIGLVRKEEVEGKPAPVASPEKPASSSSPKPPEGLEDMAYTKKSMAGELPDTTEVVEYVNKLMDLYGGEMDVKEFEKYINISGKFTINPGAAVTMAKLVIEYGKVKRVKK